MCACIEEVASSFTSKVLSQYKKMAIEWDDVEGDIERPSDLTQTMQACRAVLTAIDPLACQDFELATQCNSDFRQMKGSMLSDVHVCVTVAEDPHMKTLFCDIYENAVAYKMEYSKLKGLLEVIDDAPLDDTAELEDVDTVAALVEMVAPVQSGDYN